MAPFRRYYSTSSWVSPKTVTSESLRYILCLSRELRNGYKGKTYEFDDVKGMNVSLLLRDPNAYVQVPAVQASRMVKAKLNTVIDRHWDRVDNYTDVFKYLQKGSDAIFYQATMCQQPYHEVKTKVPLICMESNYFKLVKTLADFMAMDQHFKGLKGLKLAWIGPPSSVSNTYMLLAPKLGMNVSFYCAYYRHLPVTPAVLKDAKQICKETHTEIVECDTLRDAIKGANVVATTSCVEPDLKLTLDTLKVCDKRWCVITDLPRSRNAMSEDVFQHGNCLAWKAVDNIKWVLSAFMLDALRKHRRSEDAENT